MLVALLSLSSLCLVIAVWLFIALPWVCLQFIIVVFLIMFTIFVCGPCFWVWFVGHPSACCRRDSWLLRFLSCGFLCSVSPSLCK